MLEFFTRGGQAAVWMPSVTGCFAVSETARSPAVSPGLDIYSSFEPKYIFW